LECGGYAEDIGLWRSLAAEEGGPVLDVGAGTGRIALDLARQGHSVTALDNDGELLSELGCRAGGLAVRTVLADARDFRLKQRFALILVPMQTIQLLGGVGGRARFLRCARRHLRDGGLLVVTVSEILELYEPREGVPEPLPDIRELHGVLYSSQPTAVRADGDGFVLERRREEVSAAGNRTVESNAVRLDRLGAEQLEREARAAGLRPAGRTSIPATREYVGSVAVMLRG
jgi:SAM-dependent methyltransferase